MKPSRKPQRGKDPQRTGKTLSSEVLYGLNPVMETLRAGRRRIFELFVPEDRLSERIAHLVAEAENLGVTVTRTAPSHIGKLSGTEFHQNVAARVSPYPFAELADVLGRPNTDRAPFFLILDGVEDPMNLGALARTALGAGVDALFIPKDRAAMPTPTAVKASAGALEHLPVVLATNLNHLIRDLKKEGFWITGLDGNAPGSLYQCDFTTALALVIGGEGRGVRDLVGKSCDHLVFIPQQGPVNSLNASVAGAIAMYEVVRQRYGR